MLCPHSIELAGFRSLLAQGDKSSPSQSWLEYSEDEHLCSRLVSAHLARVKAAQVSFHWVC